MTCERKFKMDRILEEGAENQMQMEFVTNPQKKNGPMMRRVHG